jgi:hypothetical protein
MEIAQGDILAVRADCPALEIKADEKLTILENFPPRA